MLAAVAGLLATSAPAMAGNPPPTATAGTVSVEFTATEAAFVNEVSVVQPLSRVLFDTRQSMIGARVELGQRPAGTQFVFTFRANTGTEVFTWSSDPTQNSDGKDHVRVTTLGTDAYQLNWEDQPDLGDQDFNDLVMILRVGGDTDADGLFDDWERFGIDANADGDTDDAGEKDIVNGIDQDGNGSISAAEKADPLTKDIFVELDWMACSVAGSDCTDGHSHKPRAGSINRLVAAFRNHPSVDGGKGINVHVDVSNAVKHQNILNFFGADRGCGFTDASAGHGDFDTVKGSPTAPANFQHPSVRRFAFHYALAIHFENLAAVTQPAERVSGCGERPGNDFYISFADPPTELQEAGTLMHELGHNLGLRHGGGDDVHTKPNYLSVMSYTFQEIGITPSGRLDYSRQDLPDLVEKGGLVEGNGIGGIAGDVTWYWCNANDKRSGGSTGGINWNCNTGIDSGTLAGSFDINNDLAEVPLTGFDDWAKVVQTLTFQGAVSYEDGVHPDTPPDELDPVTADRLNVATPGPVIAGVAPRTAVLDEPSAAFTITAADPDSACGALTFTADNLPPGIALTNNGDCSATVAGTPTGPVGSRLVTYSVTDQDGNPDSRSAPYQVQYAFGGFSSPIDEEPTVNTARAGNTVPVKFDLGGDQGLAILAAGSPSVRRVSCDSGAPTDEVEQTVTAGASTLSFDAGSGKYQYVWKTDQSWAGTCQQLNVELVDGTTHTATFRFR